MASRFAILPSMYASYHAFMNHLIDNWPNGDYTEYLKSMDELWREKFAEDMKTYYPNNNYNQAMLDACLYGIVIYIKLLVGKVELSKLHLEIVVERNFYEATKFIVEDCKFTVYTTLFIILEPIADSRLVSLLVDNAVNVNFSAITQCENPWALIRFIIKYKPLISFLDVNHLYNSRSFIVIYYIIKEKLGNWYDVLHYNYHRRLFSFLLTGKGDGAELLEDYMEKRYDQAVYLLLGSGSVELTNKQFQRIDSHFFPLSRSFLTDDV